MSTQRLVAGVIERELLAEGLPLRTFGDLGAGPFMIAKTAERSVRGCTNDMALLCEHEIVRVGSLAGMEISSLNHHLRRNIQLYCDPATGKFLTVDSALDANATGTAHPCPAQGFDHATQLHQASALHSCLLREGA